MDADHPSNGGKIPRRGTPNALATIVYTSGTTGRPKGVMLTHQAVLSNAGAVAQLIPPRRDDVFLSCLPLAHAFERTVGYYLPMIGGATVVYSRSIESLSEDFRSQMPTVFLGVPRLYERVLAAVRLRTGGSVLKRALLDQTIKLGWKRHCALHGRGDDLGAPGRLVYDHLDRRVGARVRQAFGGKLRVAVSGGAPLPIDVARALIALGVPLVEGYGLTEAGPVVTGNSIDDNLPGSAGRPVQGVEIKTSARGELLVRSPSLMAGYWQDEAMTAEAVNGHGWLHTGDLAQIVDGRLFIRGRIKELIVMSTGEKVSPGEIETALLRDDLFEQALVVGDGRPFFSAVIVLNNDAWRQLATLLAVPMSEPNHQRVKQAVLRHMSARLEHAARHARVHAVHLTLDPWTIANGLLTPTLKTKRALLLAKFAAEIDELYA